MWKGWVVALALSLLLFNIALAASGDLDITFSGDGKVTTDVNPNRYDGAWALAIQPSDGKIIVAGDSYVPSTATHDIAVTRYKTNGSLDTTFSGDGKVVTNLGGFDQGLDIVVQANGKIVVSGQRCNSTVTVCDASLVRYNANGALDNTFSGDGKVWTDFGGGDNGAIGGLVVQSNGKIVIAGYMYNGSDYDFAVYRYNANGTLDTTFSSDGLVNIAFGSGRNDYSYELILQSGGKIVMAGTTCDASDANCDFAIARLTSAGALDTTFSGDGKQTTNFGASDTASSIAMQSDGKIVLAGNKDTATKDYFALARYTTTGKLDTTFNGTGKVTTSFAGGDARARDLVIQSNGKIVACGNGSDNFALARYNSNGALDTTFSTDGKVSVDFGQADRCNAMALQTNGRYVLAGYTDDGTTRHFALARVLP
jgi:uncharacterized delta-60 repeat protein